MLTSYGFILPRSGLATTADEAAALATRIGYPVVLKIASPDILHKTDVGGVVLNVTDETSLRRAFARMMATVKDKAPGSRVEGITVAEMVTDGTEIIIGLNNDAQFGPVIMFGLGGILANLLSDVSFRVLPITRADAQAMIREIKGYPLLAGYRGQQAVSEEMLTDLLMYAARLWEDHHHEYDSVDLNPILVRGSKHCVLDAKFLPASPRPAPSTHAVDTSYLDLFFKATSVAVVGASATPGKIGNAVLDSLARHDYKGKVYPVNPTRHEIMGLPCYSSLSAIPDRIDLVVVTVALAMVPGLIEECACLGIHNMVVISGGGKELGGESEKVETTIRRLARQHGVRIVGCNCIGVFDGETRLDTFFQVNERMVRPRQGPIAMLTQSGTIGAAFLEEAAPVGISKFVSYGNRIDVDEGDLLAYLADDPATSVIACYIEGLEDGRKFLQAARQVTERKPVVVFKAGRSHRGARAVQSHTGFLGGSYAVTAGAFRQAGVIAVDSYEELCAAAKALAWQPAARGPRVAMISNGAGTMVQAMDYFEQDGMDVPELSPNTVERLQRAYPSFYVVQNPIDVTGSATCADYRLGIEALLDDPNVDIIMPWFVFQDTPLEETIVGELARLSALRRKPILCGALGGPYTQRMIRAVEQRGVPIYGSVRAWTTAARVLYERGNR